MSCSVSFVVLHQPYLTAKAGGYTLFGEDSGYIDLTGDNGDHVSITVGTRAYAKAIADFINELGRDAAREQFRGQLIASIQQEAAE